MTSSIWMNRSGLPGWLAVTAIACASSACSGPTRPTAPIVEPPPTPISELVVQRVSADLGKPDPDAAYWRNVPRGAISLVAQPMVTPRPETTTTELVAVQAVHDGKTIAFRLVWKDAEKSEAGRLGEFSDALAIEFPVKDGPSTPVMMGAKDLPVHIFHWRAQYQRDAEQGKPEMLALYPNLSIDMYPMDFKDAPGGTDVEKESFSPGRAAGNPQSYVKTGVDEVIAEGFSTSAVQEGHSGAARGAWRDGTWALVITRPLVVEGGSVLQVGGPAYVAFAAWQGGKGEVGSRKSVTMAWLPLRVQ